LTLPTSVLVDSNLLFVHVVGCTSRDHVGRARRTEKYSVEDFDLLQMTLAEFDEVLVTPHVLAETSNLLGYIAEPLLSEARTMFAAILPPWQERFTRGTELTGTSVYLRLGLTDSALFSTASASITLLTDDLPLFIAAGNAGRSAINFTHLRQERGTL
jgi:hypothetical protein